MPTKIEAFSHEVVDQRTWLAARAELLAEEKAFTAARDALSAKRRAMPWARVDKAYRFTGPQGETTLLGLFGAKSQLALWHFMFAPGWEKPCKSCSFWADGYNGVADHMAHRDTALVATSRAPFEKLATTAERMGWTFPWFSCEDDFASDFGVSFSPEQIANGEVAYNYRKTSMRMSDLPGFSAFIRDGETVFHTYSTYARGLDMMNVAYQMLDLTALGRQEEGPGNPMSWVRLRGEYDSA
jgi:predicted dithiol-disulfide oxidoreductase (DUF899 family)